MDRLELFTRHVEATIWAHSDGFAWLKMSVYGLPYFFMDTCSINLNHLFGNRDTLLIPMQEEISRYAR